MIKYHRVTPDESKEITRLYVEEKLSSVEISQIMGVSRPTVTNHITQNGGEMRELSESQFAKNKKDFPPELLDYDFMYDTYVTQRMPLSHIGANYDCAPHVIKRLLKKHGIPLRNASTAKIGTRTGEMHHNWKGGKATLAARCREFFQTNISPIVRERNGYSCQMCGSHSNLHVHHIVSFSSILDEIIKENNNLNVKDDINELYDIVTTDARFLDTSNLITYCVNCHLYEIHGYSKTISSEDSENAE